MVNWLRLAGFQRTEELAILSEFAWIWLGDWNRRRFSLFFDLNNPENQVFLVAASPNRFCYIERLGYDIFMELHAGQLCDKMGGAEVRRQKGIPEATFNRHWADVGRFHGWRDMESYRGGYQKADV